MSSQISGSISLQCGFFRCTTLPDWPAGFSGLFNQAIHCSMSARLLNRLARFCPQFSQLLLSSSSVQSSAGGCGSSDCGLSNWMRYSCRLRGRFRLCGNTRGQRYPGPGTCQRSCLLRGVCSKLSSLFLVRLGDKRRLAGSWRSRDISPRPDASSSARSSAVSSRNGSAISWQVYLTEQARRDAADRRGSAL